MILSDLEITETYVEIKSLHERNLKVYGVKLPNLYWSGKYTQGSLSLVYLYRHQHKDSCTKKEITKFVSQYIETNDLQAPRHLGEQNGFNIKIRNRGKYKLINLTDTYPGFKKDRRILNANFDEVCKEYDYKCATCGIKHGNSGKTNGSIVKLQQGHKDPNEPLTQDNTLPQCSWCNQYYRNNVIFDDDGRIKALNSIHFVEKSSEKLQLEIYNSLKTRFSKLEPNPFSGNTYPKLETTLLDSVFQK